MAARALNSMRSRPSRSAIPECLTISSTPGFSATSQTSRPASVMRFSLSASDCSAEYSRSGTRLMSSATTRGACCATSSRIRSCT